MEWDEKKVFQTKMSMKKCFLWKKMLEI